MRIAAVQCRVIADDPSAAIAMIAAHLRRAAHDAIDLLLFPEALLLGHSYDPATIRSRAAMASDGVLDGLCRRVASFPTTLVIGAFEIRGADICNSAFVIEAGRITGRYAKAYPNEPGVTAGSDFPTFVRSGMRYGINICNDANHPDAAARVAHAGAGLILYPLNNLLRPDTAERWRARSIANLVDRARQTGCWVVSADVTGTSGDSVSHGCTAVVAPDGRIVARVPESCEGVVVQDLPVSGNRHAIA